MNALKPLYNQVLMKIISSDSES